jgi:hypothetical protein
MRHRILNGLSSLILAGFIFLVCSTGCTPRRVYTNCQAYEDAIGGYQSQLDATTDRLAYALAHPNCPTPLDSLGSCMLIVTNGSNPFLREEYINRTSIRPFRIWDTKTDQITEYGDEQSWSNGLEQVQWKYWIACFK